MGCGGSVAKKAITEQLQASERELEEQKRRLEEKDAQIATVRKCLSEHAVGSQQEAAAQAESVSNIRELRSELEARHAEHSHELERQRVELSEMHERELRMALQEREALLNERMDQRAALAMQDAQSQREALEQSHQALVRHLREAAEAEAARHRAEAESTEYEIHRLREQYAPLRREHDEAAAALHEARETLRSEQVERSSSAGRASSLERRLVEAQDEHSRAEQRYSDLEKLIKAQMRDLQGELQARTQELHQRNGVLQQRDHELSEVNSQLADLQGLFDEVNHQLQSECFRIEKLQDTVAVCAKQSKELEQLQGMLEDSHIMLAQVTNALEEERAERIRTAGLLEHEQQRTQLLLDVLKHFKEKLQGLTPQMLLSRLGCIDPKAAALLASSGTPQGNPAANSTAPAVGSSSLPPCPPVPGAPGREAIKPHAAHYIGSPRHADGWPPSARGGGSDCAASTAVPDTCSYAAWGVAHSAASARTSSPEQSPAALRPSPRGFPPRSYGVGPTAMRGDEHHAWAGMMEHHGAAGGGMAQTPWP
uniref:Uncharacterized protein n=1 Tax=Alexandrium catenella TaxID=2925 RepID=A0A7S1SCC8_ALECA|mmetsp:Transcript_9530/g.25877  ORF Transcript_9530/g.25877 Transcript_9530/m.25877 type:complete len:541 (+) Transcript_9530:125-1747(+)